MWIGNEATKMRDIRFTAGLLPGRALFTIEGPDAGHFLHNLLTADIEGLQQGQAAAGFGRALLSASARPPQPVATASRQICACHDVSEARIAAALAEFTGSAAERLQSLQSTLRCGTEHEKRKK